MAVNGFTATGTNQATAYPIASPTTAFNSVPSGTGARLPGPGVYIVANEDPLNALLVYPSTGDQIAPNGVNTPVSLAAGSAATFTCSDTALTNQPRTFYPSGTANGNNLPNGGPISVTAGSNPLIVNGNTAVPVSYHPATLMEIIGPTGVATRLVLDAFGNGGLFTIRRADGTPSSPTALQLNENIGGVAASGYNGAAYVAAAGSLQYLAAENWTATANGTYVTLSTVPAGGTVSAEALRVLSNGVVAIGTTAAAATLPVGSLVINGLMKESSSDTLTAHAGGGQASALQITSEVNRVTTVATSGDSVVLPASVAGLTVLINNSGANPMQVYGLGSDTINGVAAATGVSQMPGSEVIYVCPSAGNWEANGLGTGYFGSYETMSGQVGLTAHAGGGQASGTPITAMVAQFSTVATTGDSAVLPSATGLPSNSILSVTVVNTGANSMNVFCPTGGTMNGTSNGSVAVTNTTPVIFYAFSPTAWVSK